MRVPLIAPQWLNTYMQQSDKNLLQMYGGFGFIIYVGCKTCIKAGLSPLITVDLTQQKI